MDEIRKIFDKVISEISPKPQELKIIQNIVKEISSLLDTRAKQLNITYTKIEAQGSTGIKKTQLRGDFDIDLFIGLDYEHYKHQYNGLSKNKLKKELKQLFLKLCNDWFIKALKGKNFTEPLLLYAEHPYITIYYLLDHTQIKIDIVLFFDL
jgi:tRNA nucleotidyltransferase (CCA-adding enzyme)